MYLSINITCKGSNLKKIFLWKQFNQIPMVKSLDGTCSQKLWGRTPDQITFFQLL